MLFEKFINNNLGHVSYIIADENEAMIIDPLRNIEKYVKFIQQNNLKLKYIFNTHTHADYIGGHLELISKYPTAQNIFQKDVPAKFDFIKVKEGDVFNIGNLKIKILETPGHTPFCISCVVNEHEVDKYIFTGDFLFVGDIGRPDLLGNEKLEELVELSYKSAKKLWNLKEDIIVFTSHIKGSLCGKNLSSQYFSTIGIEKQTNKSFGLVENKDNYINNLLNQYIETPLFFRKMAKINIEGPNLVKNLFKINYLNYKEFIKSAKKGIIIDIRHPNSFKKGFIKGSINIYENSNIEYIAGSLIDVEKNLFLVGDCNNFDKYIQKLRNIGFDNIIAVLNDKVSELENTISFDDNYKIILSLDENLEADIYIPLTKIKDYKFENTDYKIVCKNGYKSSAVKSYILGRK